MKRIVTLFLFILIVCQLGLDNNVASASSANSAGMNEAYLKRVLAKTMATQESFVGESNNWNAYLKVNRTLETGAYGSIGTEISFQLRPKETWSQEILKKAQYVVTTDTFSFSGNQWLTPRDAITMNFGTNLPMPKVVQVSVEVGLTRYPIEVFTLTSLIPDNIISAKQALINAFELFHRVYGIYPPEVYEFEVVYYDGYWNVVLEDNDGIGGVTSIAVDAYTGFCSDIREEE